MSLLALTAFTARCKKNEPEGAGTITVKPAADTLYVSDDCEMRFDVVLADGRKSERTKIAVSSLPPELSATFEKESGARNATL